MGSEMRKQELAFVCRGAICLDVIAYGISIPLVGITLSFCAGLLLGTAILLLRLLLLYDGIRRAAAAALQTGYFSVRRQRLNYLLRMLLFAAAFAAAYCFAPVAALGTALPMLYPRLLYTADAVFFKRPVPERGESPES